jgi:hypothetical protein
MSFKVVRRAHIGPERRNHSRLALSAGQISNENTGYGGIRAVDV